MIRYLSSADASRLLAVTPATVRLMVKRGKLRVSAMTEGGIQLFERTDVEKLAHWRAERRLGDAKDGA